MNNAPVTTKKALLAALVCNGLWGFSFMASRVAMDAAPVLLLLSHRFLLAFLLMSLLRLTPLGACRFRGRSLLPLLLLGLFQPVVYFLGEQYGILHSNTIFSGVMIALIPIAATLAAIPFLGEKPTLRQLFCSLLSVGGVVGIGLLSGSGGGPDGIGLAGLLTAIVSAAAFLLLSRKISSSYTAFERTYVMLGIGAAVFTVLALLSVHGDLGAFLRPLREGSYLGALLFLAACCSVICYFLSNYMLSGLTVARAAVFANLTTAISVFAGAVFLHEPFSFAGFVCCVIILIGIYGVQSSPPAQKRDRTPSAPAE